MLLKDEQKLFLLRIARETVERYVKEGVVTEFDISDNRLKEKEGAFVTLHTDGKLRGCIGQILPSNDMLWKVVRNMAIEAAVHDPRFLPVSMDELPDLEYEISVLSRPEAIDDWRRIELGKHGVIARQGIHSGVFLPQVAIETGWSREEFLSQLCRQKAGLDPDAYLDPDLELSVFTVQICK